MSFYVSKELESRITESDLLQAGDSFVQQLEISLEFGMHVCRFDLQKIFISNDRFDSNIQFVH